MSTALIAPAYAEIARAYKHFVLLNGSPVALEFLLNASVTGASLQTWLGTPANLTQFEQLIASLSGAAAMCASGTAMTAVAASSTAMTAVAASSTAMTAVVATSVARTAVYDSTTAWGAISASATAKAALSNASTEVSSVSPSYKYPPSVTSATRVVLIQQRSDNSSIASYAKGATAAEVVTASATYIDRYLKMTGLQHRTVNSAYPSYIRYLIME